MAFCKTTTDILNKGLKSTFLLLYKNFKSELKSRDIKRLTISFFHQVHP